MHHYYIMEIFLFVIIFVPVLWLAFYISYDDWRN